MDFVEIKQLIQTVDASSVTEVELEVHGVKIKIKKETNLHALPSVQASPANVVVPEQPQPLPQNVPAGKPEQSKERDTSKLVEICAPMVGTFFRSPSPDSQPYVQAGDMVSPGQSLCIIEAMKLMNEIEAEQQGKLVEVLVEDGEVVEYGQPLFLLEPLD